MPLRRARATAVLTDELASFARYVAGLRGFFHDVLTPAECRRRVRAGLAARNASFLSTLERGVYGMPRSPYLALLRRAGIELGDVARLVSDEGLEGALGRLHDEGVHVTIEEFKRHRPIVRSGLELETTPASFDNPLLGRARVAFRSRGSSGRERRALADLAHLEQEAVYQWLFLEAFGLEERPLGFWRPAPPGAAGLKNTAGYSKLGLTVERWFSQSPHRLTRRAWRDYAICEATVRGSRRFGTPMPRPEHVPVTEARLVASWLAAKAAAGTPALLDTTASCGVRACLAASELGLDISGTVFRAGGEPLTQAKADAVAQARSRMVCHYSMGEVARVGIACASPSALDDVHIVCDKVAVVQRDQDASGPGPVGALFLTTLVPSSPKLLLNVESDDYGILERRSCGCALGDLGLDLHLHGIRSYEKLTSEGMNFLGDELIALVEHVLPARFGGSAADYQLVEEEVGGLPKVGILASPRLGELDEVEVIRTVLDALGRGPSSRGMMAGVWADGETLRVLRREPYATQSAKVLPLHSLRPPARPR